MYDYTMKSLTYVLKQGDHSLPCVRKHSPKKKKKKKQILQQSQLTQGAIWLIFMLCKGLSMAYHCIKFRLKNISQTLVMSDFLRASVAN